MSLSLTKSRISITLLPNINYLLGQISEKTGVSKSQLIENATQKYLLETLDEDSKILANLTFDDLPSEDEWLSLSTEF